MSERPIIHNTSKFALPQKVAQKKTNHVFLVFWKILHELTHLMTFYFNQFVVNKAVAASHASRSLKPKIAKELYTIQSASGDAGSYLEDLYLGGQLVCSYLKAHELTTLPAGPGNCAYHIIKEGYINGLLAAIKSWNPTADHIFNFSTRKPVLPADVDGETTDLLYSNRSVAISEDMTQKKLFPNKGKKQASAVAAMKPSYLSLHPVFYLRASLSEDEEGKASHAKGGMKVTKRKRVESEREEEEEKKTKILDDENAEACEALMVPDASWKN
jgi:hypothetical protein